MSQHYSDTRVRKHAKRTPHHLRPEQLALLRELDTLGDGQRRNPVRLDALARAAGELGGSMARNGNPSRAMAMALRGIEAAGCVGMERTMRRGGNGSLDMEASYATITAQGRAMLHPAKQQPSRNNITPPPTWRGECMMQSAPVVTNVMNRPPVMRPGADDFRSCASRGV